MPMGGQPRVVGADIQAKDGPATSLAAKPDTLEKTNSTAVPAGASAQHGEIPPPGANSNSLGAAAAAPVAQDHVLRADPTHFGQAYSERNPPPKIQDLRTHQEERQEASRRYFEHKQQEPAKPSEAKQEPDTTGHEEPTSDDEVKAGATDDVPIGAEKSNVLFHPTPNIDFNGVFEALHEDSMRISYVVTVAIILLDWMFIGGGFKGFVKSLLPAFGVATAVYYILSGVGQSAASQKVDSMEPKTERLRYVPESVEWMNSLVETLWHTLQKDFFDNIASQVNDTIKPYIPENVPATVKITEIGHGSQSLRILSMRSLPDHEFGDMIPSHGIDKSGSIEQVQEREKAIEREEGGVFYNLEIAVAYHGPPFRSRKDHMHTDILATIGPVPVPIFVQVKEFVATVRVRLQMHPDLPFLKNLTFALTENPKVDACVSLGAPWALDLLNLPIVDNLLVSQLNTAAADFVQPKSMSLDMTAYVGGSDQKEDTDAIGVLFVKIHRARNLARQDTRGPGADPYLTIAFSKYEKPMYASRIIKGDRNPVWEETAIIMIRAEHVKRQEDVLLRLWDSDTTGSDDVSGVCEFPLQELILKANEMQKREDQLQGDAAGTDAEGVLEWEIGYFPKAGYEKALRTDAMDPRDHHGEKQEVAEEDKTQDAQNTVPDPNLPSGILGLTIHQCINVQIDNPNKKSMGHVQTQRTDSDGEISESEETVSIDYIPSLYVTADINDELVYRTRVKNISNAPTFQSSTETYVRDWRLASLTLGVWDTRKKKDDCLVGIASLKLSDAFHNSSSVVKFYDLKGGAGSGRIRVSMIFRSMRMKLEESLLGFDVGSFVFSSPIVCTGDVYSSKLRLRSSATSRLLKSGSKSEGGYTYTLEESQATLPVHWRYMSAIVFEFVGAGLTEKVKGPIGRNKHYAVLWLFRLIDNKEEDFTLPVYKTNNPNRLTQNVVHEPDDKMTLTKVGEVKFTGRFKAGLDEAHDELKMDHDHWSTYQCWQAARKSGE